MDHFREDQELIERTLSGDERACTALIERHQATVARVISRITGRREGVEDLVQETFLRVFQNLSRFKRQSSFLTWLYRIAVNVSLEALRREKARARVQERMAELALADSLIIHDRETGERRVLDRELQSKVRAALNELSPETRALLTLRYLEELSTPETAEALDLPEGTVRRRLWEARMELGRVLAPYLETQDAGLARKKERT